MTLDDLPYKATGHRHTRVMPVITAHSVGAPARHRRTKDTPAADWASRFLGDHDAKTRRAAR